jgi:hypothetical protein
MDQIEMHYLGDAIVPDASVLRRLPSIVDLEQRFLFDALVTAADIMTGAFATLKAIAGHAGGDVERLGNQGRAAALSAAWTIVDQLHAARQLVMQMIKTPVTEIGPITGGFIDAAAPARALRNKMDHLSTNIPNLAKAKGRRSPLFGTLSYFFCGPHPIRSGVIITIMAGAIHGDQTMPVANPAGQPVAPPADLFQLSAFGITLKLGPPLAAFRQYIVATEKHLEAQLHEQVSRLSAEHGIPMEKLMAHNGGRLALAMDIEFNELAQAVINDGTP